MRYISFTSDREQGLGQSCPEPHASTLFHISRERDLFLLAP